MKSTLINRQDDLKTYAVIFETHDEVVGLLERFAAEKQLKAASFTGIGAFSQVTLGFFDFSVKDYKKIIIKEQVELLSLLGDITLNNDKHHVHPHVVVGKSDGSAHGGHLLKAFVHPTVELIITESPGYLRRQKDEETGLALININNNVNAAT